MIFETGRLVVRQLGGMDAPGFFELMSNPNVMNPIPEKTLNKVQSDSRLKELIRMEKTSDTKIWCLCEKGDVHLIGICGVLKNDENQVEMPIA